LTKWGETVDLQYVLILFERFFLKRRGSSVVEHVPEEHSVDGSIPSPGTIYLKTLSFFVWIYYGNAKGRKTLISAMRESKCNEAKNDQRW
jgi:hypothetical protein